MSTIVPNSTRRTFFKHAAAAIVTATTTACTGGDLLTVRAVHQGQAIPQADANGINVVACSWGLR